MSTLLITQRSTGRQAKTSIQHGELTVGRDETNHIVLAFPEIEDHHCEIRYTPQGCLVRDYDSSGGTFIGEERIRGESSWPLDKDLRVGNCVLRLLEEKAPTVDPAIGRYKAKIREALVDHPEVKRLIHTGAGDTELGNSLRRLIREAAAGVARPAGLTESALVKEMVDEILGLGPLEDLMRDETVQEIMVNRWDQILVERIRGRRPDGLTAMYDALGLYLESAERDDGRTILVIFTDGGDTRSTLRFSDAMTLIRASDVTVYAVGFLEHQRIRDRSLPKIQLTQLATESGGQAFFPLSMKEIDEAYDKILAQIRAQYSLGYVSSNLRQDGRWRKVDIKVRRPDLKDLRIQTRKGYFAPYRP